MRRSTSVQHVVRSRRREGDHPRFDGARAGRRPGRAHRRRQGRGRPRLDGCRRRRAPVPPFRQGLAPETALTAGNPDQAVVVVAVLAPRCRRAETLSVAADPWHGLFPRRRRVDNRGNMGAFGGEASASAALDLVALSQVSTWPFNAGPAPCGSRTAPGDDGTAGTAFRYELRYSLTAHRQRRCLSPRRRSPRSSRARRRPPARRSRSRSRAESPRSVLRRLEGRRPGRQLRGLVERGAWRRRRREPPDHPAAGGRAAESPTASAST